MRLAEGESDHTLRHRSALDLTRDERRSLTRLMRNRRLVRVCLVIVLGAPLAASSQLAANPNLTEKLRAHVATLATDIGQRNRPHYEGLVAGRDYVQRSLAACGYDAALVGYEFDGSHFDNIEARLPGRSNAPGLVIGAHYDSAIGTPGANDNASGVAVLIELACALRRDVVGAPVRFVAFANEEPPYFHSRNGMGSYEYAQALERPKATVRAMISIESVGFYSDEPGSQHYPPLVSMLYPDRGNFLAFVSDLGSRRLARSAAEAFRQATTLPAETASLPGWITGISWSDHRSFWEIGVPAIMVTDTATFRDPNYHRPTDTADHLDYRRMAEVTRGLRRVVQALAAESESEL